MSACRVLLLGDGPNELGARLGESLAPESLPPLARLVHRLLGEPVEVTYVCGLFRNVRPPHGKGAKLARKVMQAFLEAAEGKFQALVIVIDRDRKSASETILLLRKGRDQVDAAWSPVCAVGTAVETFDAWMICDGKAIDAAGGQGRLSHGDPEAMDGLEGTGRHPKDRAVRLFGSADALTEAYKTVAARLGLSLVETRCPKGFAPFAEEVRQRIGPLVSQA